MNNNDSIQSGKITAVVAYSQAVDALNHFSHDAVSFRNFVDDVKNTVGAFEKPRVVYLFDSNICLSFLRPSEHVFMEASGVSRLFSRRHQLAVERMTVRYLLEGMLPGQDAEPVFLAPAHWNELIRKATGYITRNENYARKLLNVEITEEKISRMRKAGGDPESLVKVAKELNIALALQELSDALDLARRVEILLGKEDEFGRVRGFGNATSLGIHAAWNEAREVVSWRTEGEWRRCIADVKRESERARINGMPPQEREVERDRLRRSIISDAESLALIETLFLVDPQAGGESPRRKYIFVTSDTGLLEASRRQRSRLAGNGVPEFVHSPALFLPFADYQHFHTTISAIEGSTKTSQETSRKIMEALSSLNFQSFDTNKRQLPNLRRNWNNAADLLTLIGNERFVQDFSGKDAAEKVQQTFNFLSYDRIGAEVEKKLQSNMGNVTRRHDRLSVKIAIRSLPKKLAPPKVGTSAPRAPIHFLNLDVLKPLREVGLTKSENWHDFISELRDDSHRASELSQRAAEKVLEIWSSKQGQLPAPSDLLLTAALLTSARSWPEALKCANWAAHTARSRKRSDRLVGAADRRSKSARYDPIEFEARYLSALNLRMSLKSPQQHRTAKDNLSENIQARTGALFQSVSDRLARYRDVIEKATLDLTAAVIQCFEEASIDDDIDQLHAERYFDAEVLANTYQSAIDNLEDAADDLENDFVVLDSPTGEAALALNLALRARSNILAAEINRHFQALLQPEVNSINQIKVAAKYVRDLKSGYPLDIQISRSSRDIYLKVADFILSDQSARSDFEELMDEFSVVKSHNTAIPDSREMESLQNCVKGLAERRGHYERPLQGEGP